MDVASQKINTNVRLLLEWAKIESPEADDKLLHYAMEGIRLNGTFGSYRLCTVEKTIDDNGRPVTVKPGDKVFTSFVDANREAEYFPEPNTIKTDRPMENYIHYGLGSHACLGGEASRTALTAMLRVVGRLDNLRRAPGPQGYVLWAVSWFAVRTQRLADC